ncbi:poly(A) polymerase [Tistlia consotensis]|uniref:Poly(A) polymerase n=1 Tax=Tistlia consotensis USBA 355 TaxID=560819 RepID=A0A1Y6CBE8_9PROT|nr:CCA tRNA nucleotidyltransferase [Tistlia consotensis]SMF46520.1 poly(A) polymerase [Tistlia consotensis USBA 355]SNR78304.1 poly(A) polymerase [Tistlia consotensis]
MDRLPPQPWMTAPATRAVVAALEAEGAGVRFVGGCVRDALLGRAIRDVDIATPDPPDKVLALLKRAGLKAVPTGLAHGTVTAVSGHRPFEITTLRHDVETFGRHARVAFTDDWRADAARRDFTFNALSLEPDGALHDYFGGIEDLRAGRVRFVGEARRRIAEDYLRLLRFFRFFAFYGRGAPDAEALAAAAEAAPQLTRLSGERVRAELFRLLEAPDPVPVLRLMTGHRILAAELPEAGDPGTVARLLPVEGAGAPDPLLRLAAWLETDAAGAGSVAERLRLSNAERLRLAVLVAPPLPVSAGETRERLRVACHRLGSERVADLLRLAAARSGSSVGLEAALAVVDGWVPAALPVKGRDLATLGMPPGPEMGRLLDELEGCWTKSDFTLDRDVLMAIAARILRR